MIEVKSPISLMCSHNQPSTERWRTTISRILERGDASTCLGGVKRFPLSVLAHSGRPGLGRTQGTSLDDVSSPKSNSLRYGKTEVRHAI